MGRTSDGARPPLRLWGPKAAGGGVETGRGWGAVEQTHNHTLRRALALPKGEPLAHSGTPRACATLPDAQTGRDGRAPRASHAGSWRQIAVGAPAGRRQAVRWVARRCAGTPFSGSARAAPGKGSRASRGRRGGRSTHSTLQQLMQPFCEPYRFCSAARVAVSKTSRTPSLVLAEHSR